MNNWNEIGAVVVRTYGSLNPKWYASLNDAMIAIARSYSSYWEKIPLLEQINYRGGMMGDGWLISGDRYVIRDDLGLLIPHWKIVDAYNSLSNDERDRHWYRREKNYKFRNGPVPGIRCYHTGWRKPKKLWQAVKADHYDKHDEELKEYRFKRRDYHDRFMEFIDWDCDKDDWRNRNWKRHRKNQWKE